MTNQKEPLTNKRKPFVQTKNNTNNKHILLYLSIIIVLTFIAFSSCLNNGFTWDDAEQVVNNIDIKALTTANISKIFTNYYIGMYQPQLV